MYDMRIDIHLMYIFTYYVYIYTTYYVYIYTHIMYILLQNCHQIRIMMYDMRINICIMISV